MTVSSHPADDTLQEDTGSRERVLTATGVEEQATSFGSETPNVWQRVSRGLRVLASMGNYAEMRPSTAFLGQHASCLPRPPRAAHPHGGGSGES